MENLFYVISNLRRFLWILDPFFFFKQDKKFTTKPIVLSKGDLNPGPRRNYPSLMTIGLLPLARLFGHRSFSPK